MFYPSIGGVAVLSSSAGVNFTGEDGRPEVDQLLETLTEGGVTKVAGDVEKGKYGGAITYTVPISRTQGGNDFKGSAKFILSGHSLYTFTVCVPTDAYNDGYDEVLTKVMDSIRLGKSFNPLGEDDSSNSTDATPSTQPKDPASYEQIPWSDLARTPDTYTGKSISISGRVLQVVEGSELNQLRVATNGDYDDVVLVGYSPQIMNGTRVLEDDQITVLGTYLGTVSYETTMGATKTLPGIYADSVQIN
ncbi:hypothetical protein ATOBIA_N05520 [Atopobiaceae bacterium P1]|nr:hypothetical protein ATOBIA_N05520 [Atopobiaceae bacterium P1]